MKQKRLSKLLSAVLSAALVLSLAPAALAAEGETHITIIGTSDTHGNVWGYSYEDMAESTDDGLARISTYVNQVRAENPNTILVDTGDTIQGTIMTDDLYSKDTANHPVPAAMNYMGYDAWTLGNHEFNFGVDTLKSILAQAEMPVLAANIKNADGSYLTGAGYTIVERGGVNVAIIGVTTPNIPRWDGTKQGVEELTFEPLADAVNECIDAIGGHHGLCPRRSGGRVLHRRLRRRPDHSGQLPRGGRAPDGPHPHHLCEQRHHPRGRDRQQRRRGGAL